MKNFFKNDRGLVRTNHSGGFIETILIIVGALIFLKYVYNLDVVGLLTEGRFKELLDNFYSLGSEGWDKYKDVIIKVCDYIFSILKDLWEKFRS